MFRNLKIMATLFTFMVIGATFASAASAECGPGFSSKAQLISYYKHNPSAAQGLRKELLAHSAYTGYHADETVLNYLRDPEQKVFTTPSGYVLNKNTYCPGGPGKYQPYHGLLTNMPGKVMLWHCPKGSDCVPLLKGYCMNFVMGPPVKKSHPPKRHPHQCKCKKPPKPKPQCSTKSPAGGGGNCNEQVVTVTPKQECEATNHSGTNCQQTTTTVVLNCSNYSADNPGNVNQGGNCNNGGTETCVGQNNCNTENPPPPACPCKPEEPEKPSILITSTTQLNMIPAGKNSGPFKIGVNASKAGGTLTVDPGIGSVSSCSSSTQQESLTISVPAGMSEQCVIIYAPENDADKPTSMTVTETAILGSAHDQKEQTFKITYPTRPE